MTNAELIAALRECEYCNVCSIAVDGDCPFGGRDALEVAAADALEAAEKRIEELSLDCEMFQQKCMELDAQLPKEGKWIPINWTYDSILKCSNCGGLACCCGNYCPNCGAKMRGEHDEQIH